MSNLQQDNYENSLDPKELDENTVTATADESDNAFLADNDAGSSADAGSSSTDAESSTIDNEIEQTVKAVGAVIVSLEHMRDLISKGHKSQDEAALLKVIRPMSMNIENSLPALHDFIDNLLAIGEAEQATEVRRKLERIEDELLPVILQFLEDHK